MSTKLDQIFLAVSKSINQIKAFCTASFTCYLSVFVTKKNYRNLIGPGNLGSTITKQFNGYFVIFIKIDEMVFCVFGYDFLQIFPAFF